MRNEDIQMPFYHVIMDLWPALKSDLVSVQQNEEWWSGIIDKYGDLSEKYDGTLAGEFARAMCIACVDQLERMYRIQTGNMESVFGGQNEQKGMRQALRKDVTRESNDGRGAESM